MRDLWALEALKGGLGPPWPKWTPRPLALYQWDTLHLCVRVEHWDSGERGTDVWLACNRITHLSLWPSSAIVGDIWTGRVGSPLGLPSLPQYACRHPISRMSTVYIPYTLSWSCDLTAPYWSSCICSWNIIFFSFQYLVENGNLRRRRLGSANLASITWCTVYGNVPYATQSFDTKKLLRRIVCHSKYMRYSPGTSREYS